MIKEEAKQKLEAEREREVKPQRNTTPKQKKVELYHDVGQILLVWGIFGYVYYVLKQFEKKGIAVLFITNLDTLLTFAFNVFLWAGLILLWRADKNENPDRKSKWLTLLKVYVLISLILTGATFAIPIVMRIVR